MDVKIIVLLIIWLMVYLTAPLIKQRKFHIKYVIPVLLAPMILFKVFIDEGHFENFMTRNLDVTSGLNWGLTFEILGLSYFTFLAISYLIDTSRGYIKPEKNAFKLLLYLIYFPTIFSGPLHRYKYLSGQFQNVSISSASVIKGMRLMLWGFFGNLVLAPRIIKMFNLLNSGGISGPFYLLIGLLFFIYLYISFSSFIHIFQGVSSLFNIQLKENFRSRIYLSHSRQDFWRGWHMTLNDWFRDYFFFPFAKRNKSALYVNLILLLTFFLIAMWHEISTPMITWGILNGLWIVIEKRVPFKNWRYRRLRKVLGVFYHLFFASILALVFISPSFNEIILKITQKPSIPIDRLGKFNYIIVIVLFIIMDWLSHKAKNIRIDEAVDNRPVVVRWGLYVFLALSILIFGVSGQVDNYYIQF